MKKRDIDGFYLELVVQCKIDNGRIKGYTLIDLLINDKSKVVERGNVLEIEQLEAALRTDGNYMIYNCSCGHPGCAGLNDGITITTEGELLHWQDWDADEVFVFEKLTIQMQLTQLEKDLVHFEKKFKEFGITLDTE